MNDPPEHTAELSAANLLSFCGMIVPMYCLTMSSCSRRPESMSRKSTPFDSRSAWSLWYTTSDSYWAPTPARYFFSASGIPSLSQVSLMSAGRASQEAARLCPGVCGAGGRLPRGAALPLRRPDVVVDVLEVDPRKVGAPARHRAREEVV